jgi:hypothetical protein
MRKYVSLAIENRFQSFFLYKISVNMYKNVKKNVRTSFQSKTHPNSVVISYDIST